MGSKLVLKHARARAAGVAIGALLVVGLISSGGGTAVAAEISPSPPPLLQRDANVVTSDPIPTVQIDNGYVWAQTTIGSTVYAVGRFDNAREPGTTPGTALTARSNVLAYDINSGALLPFAPQVNGTIRAVVASPDGSRIYVGGSFSTVNGQERNNVAVLDAATGQLVPGVVPSIGGSGVYALAASGSSVYAGGLFTQADGVARKNLALFSATDGALSSWAPQTDQQVDAMMMDPAGQNVIIGGRFAQVNGDAAMRGVAALNISTGVVDTAWALSRTVTNSSSASGQAGIFSLTADTTAVYGTAWAYLGDKAHNLEGTFAAEAGTGKVRWIADCHGDHYGVYSTGKVVYTTSHMHSCATMGQFLETTPATNQHAEAYTADARGTLSSEGVGGYADWSGNPAPSAYQWAPQWAVGTTSGLGQAGLSITGTGNMISIGGEFRSVNNRQFEGLVRFSTTPPNGAKDGPRLSGEGWVATATSESAGQARVSIPSNWDRDDLALSYDLWRTGANASNAPVATTTADGTWWKQSTIALVDPTAPPGTQQEYTVVARDGDGNTVNSQPISVAVSAAAAPVEPVEPAEPASDDFNRTMNSGWGSADVGSDWAITAGAPSGASVANGWGKLSVAPSEMLNATLDSSAVTDTVLTTKFRVDQGALKGGAYVGVVARSTAAGKYLVRAWLRPDGTVWLRASLDGTLLFKQQLTGMKYAANSTYILKVSATGDSPTTLSAKLWVAGTPQPTDWQLTGTDATLHGAGAVGLSAQRTVESTTTLGVTFDSFVMTTAP